jgi:hypothetical protein
MKLFCRTFAASGRYTNARYPLLRVATASYVFCVFGGLWLSAFEREGTGAGGEGRVRLFMVGTCMQIFGMKYVSLSLPS